MQTTFLVEWFDSWIHIFYSLAPVVFEVATLLIDCLLRPWILLPACRKIMNESLMLAFWCHIGRISRGRKLTLEVIPRSSVLLPPGVLKPRRESHLPSMMEMSPGKGKVVNVFLYGFPCKLKSSLQNGSFANGSPSSPPKSSFVLSWLRAAEFVTSQEAVTCQDFWVNPL